MKNIAAPSPPPLVLKIFLPLTGSGTKRHNRLLKQSRDNMIGGTFCLTEISHGTNTKVCYSITRTIE